MKIEKQINDYLETLSAPKLADMRSLHNKILTLKPKSKLWFLDGKNDDNKIVTNPNIGYGLYTIKYADGSKKDFYQIGISANTSGISVYILGIKDKTLLARKYGSTIGKAKVTGYCIKFKALSDIDLEVLKAAINFGFEAQQE